MKWTKQQPAQRGWHWKRGPSGIEPVHVEGNGSVTIPGTGQIPFASLPPDIVWSDEVIPLPQDDAPEMGSKELRNRFAKRWAKIRQERDTTPDHQADGFMPERNALNANGDS